MTNSDDIARYTTRHAGQIREVVNRNALVSRLVLQGYNVFFPAYDARIDFVVHREADEKLIKVQLKGRWTIDQKYLGRDLWIAFADAADGAWYLMPHDEMVTKAERGVVESLSWTKEGGYSRPKLSAAVIAQCAPYRFAPIAEVAAKAADEDAA